MAPQLTSAYFHSQALMTLFVMYSQDGWANIMYDGLDAVAEDIEVPVISLVPDVRDPWSLRMSHSSGCGRNHT